jgi:hypothetical protein
MTPFDGLYPCSQKEISIFLESRQADPLPCTPIEELALKADKRKRPKEPESKPAKHAKANSAGEVEFELSENRYSRDPAAVGQALEVGHHLNLLIGVTLWGHTTHIT